MKKLLFVLLSNAFVLVSSGQWLGPTNGWLSTSNSVGISQLGGQSGMPGTTFNPLLSLSLTGFPTSGPGSVPGGTLFPLHVTYEGRVGIGTNTPLAGLHIMNSNFLMSKSNGGELLNINPIGSLKLTTDGNANSFRGLFISNGTNDFFSVTPIDLSYTGNVFINSGNLIIKDAGGDIQFKVYNDGFVRAREVKVNLATIPPDYVFEKNYKLLTIEELEKYIILNKHLPNIPSAKEMTEEGGIDLSAMQFKMLEKIEELTLYIIQLKADNEELKKKVCALESKN